MSPDPHSAVNFDVEIGGQAIGFAEVSGLGAQIEYGPPGSSASTAVVNAVTFRRAVTADLTLWNWLQGVLLGTAGPRTITVALLDSARNPVCVWTLKHARPVTWSGPVLNANSAAIAMEELVVIADELDFAAG